MEVTLVGSDVTRWTRVIVPKPLEQAASPCCCPPLEDAAGSAMVSTGSGKLKDCFVFWRFQEASPCTLEVTQLSPHQELPVSGLQLSFEEALCPFANIYANEVNDAQGLHFRLTAVAVSGLVYILKLPVAVDSWSSIALSSSNLFVRDFSSEFVKLRQVTKFASSANMLYAGGETGSVLCIALFTDANAGISYELKPGDAGLSRIWGLVSRTKSLGPVRSLVVDEAGSKTILLALYHEGVLQVWDPLYQVRLFTSNVCSQANIEGALAVSMWLEEGISATPKKLAILFVVPETQAQAVYVYSLDASLGGISLGPAVAIPLQEGKVGDVKLLEGGIWILKDSKARSDYELIHVKTQLGFLSQHFRLQEQEISSRLMYDENLFLNELVVSLSAEPYVPKLFMRRILEPGTFHRETLSEVLRGRGVFVSDTDIRLMSAADWQERIIEAMRLEVTSDSVASFKCWAKFANEYLSIWRKRNAPFVLFCDAKTGCIGLLRRCSFSIFRLQTSVEKASIVSHSPGDAGRIMDSLLKCIREITHHLGRFPLALFHECLLQPTSQPLDLIISSYLQILEVGYQSRGQRGTYLRELHREQRKFNVLVISTLRENTAQEWDTVIDLLMAYSKQILEFGLHSSGQKICSLSKKGSAFTKLLSKAASQILFSHYEAARDMVLFLSFLLNIKGQVNLSGSEASRIQQKLLPQLKKNMVTNLILHLLSVAYGEAPSSDDFSSLLSSLRLDGGNADSLWAGSGFSLLDILTSFFLDATPASLHQYTGALMEKGDLLDFARGFVSWLLMGEEAKRQRFSHRTITLSSLLLQQRQYQGLEEFLSVAEKFSNERHLVDTINGDDESTARLYLLGLSTLARACSDPDSGTKLKQVAAASSYFFRAAAGLREEDEVFQPLFSKPDSLPKLQFFEKVMQIFELYNLSEGAMEFAIAALDQIDGENRSLTNFVGIKGRLWANVFKFAMDLGLYADAYCAIISNPDAESRHTCLRRFVVLLCEEKAVQILCGGELPCVGLLEDVEQELAWKAEYSDIGSTPSAYKLLYAFHAQRHNYRRSAAYMYRYAVRMKEEGATKSRLPVAVSLQEHVNALAAVINALSLVNPTYAWLDCHNTGFTEYASPSKRSRVAGTFGQASTNVEKISENHVVGIDDLEKEYAVALGKLELANAKVKHPTFDMQPSEIVCQLVENGKNEVALSIVFKLWKDSLLRRELEKVFSHMARQCCTPQYFGPKQKLLLSGPLEDTGTGGGSKASWQALQANLEKYRALHPRLLVVVAEAILSANRQMELPVWLVDMFKGGRSANSLGMAGQESDPAALLRIYLDSGRLSEAAFLVLEYFKAAANMRPSDVLKRKRMSATWFPYTLIIRLQFLLSQQARNNDAQMEELEQSVNAAAQLHLDQMKADTKDIASLL